MQKLFTVLLLIPICGFAQTNFVGAPNAQEPGSYNILIGLRVGQAMAQNAWYNTFVGFQTGQNNTEGSGNVFIGSQSGQSNTTGNSNVFVGVAAGISNKTAIENTFIGNWAGFAHETGHYNTLIGSYAGYSNATGVSNFFGGNEAGRNSKGSYNVFLGAKSGFSTTTGNANTFVGSQAGYNNTTGSNNIIIGPNSGTAVTNGNENVLIGYNSQAEDGLHNATAIGSDARVAISNALILGNQANVGIGTSAPASRLEVVSEKENSSGLRLSKLTTSSPASLETSEFLAVNSQGDVVKSRYRLQITDASQWSDKVFAPTYSLRPLTSVSAFIKQKGHLPGIPSAEEVVKKGVDLIKMNALLLEKIEELTLYSIQLEQTNQEQKQINKRLQSQIDEIKRLLEQRSK